MGTFWSFSSVHLLLYTNSVHLKVAMIVWIAHHNINMGCHNMHSFLPSSQALGQWFGTLNTLWPVEAISYQRTWRGSEAREGTHPQHQSAFEIPLSPCHSSGGLGSPLFTLAPEPRGGARGSSATMLGSGRTPALRFRLKGACESCCPEPYLTGSIHWHGCGMDRRPTPGLPVCSPCFTPVWFPSTVCTLKVTAIHHRIAGEATGLPVACCVLPPWRVRPRSYWPRVQVQQVRYRKVPSCYTYYSFPAVSRSHVITTDTCSCMSISTIFSLPSPIAGATQQKITKFSWMMIKTQQNTAM